jgi:arginine deiminase
VLVEDRMNVRDSAGNVVRPVNPGRRLTIDVYEKREGRYEKVMADGDFQPYVEGTLGFTLIPVTAQDQLKYGINFLTVGERRILAIDGVSAALKEALRAAGVDATWMDFGNLTGGYGAAHCTTQVLSRGL